MDEHKRIRLHIPENIVQLLEGRLIHEEDLQRAIHHAETTGMKFIKLATGRYLTSHRPDRVTYWVEYSPADECYQIHSAYSHRMEMKRA